MKFFAFAFCLFLICCNYGEPVRKKKGVVIDSKTKSEWNTIKNDTTIIYNKKNIKLDSFLIETYSTDFSWGRIFYFTNGNDTTIFNHIIDAIK
jgi:hypothetical protein